MFSVGLALFLLLCSSCEVASFDDYPNQVDITMYELVRDVLLAFFAPRDIEENIASARRMNKLQDPPPFKEFPCNTSGFRSPTVPTNVHRLRPGDIDVIGAMGDSLSASNGNTATNIFQVFVENRGRSWNSGGERTWREFLTLPNILKEFNPQLIGYSEQDAFVHARAAQFNVAEAGAMSKDMPAQAKLLVQRMKSDPRVDFEKHWKMVTIFVGGNDFCLELCYINRTTFIEEHRRNLTEALDYLRDNLPRTFVNLVLAANPETLANFTDRPLFCSVLNIVECPCFFTYQFEEVRSELVETIRQWQKIQFELAASGAYSGKEDFAVVAQPFTLDVSIPIIKTTDGDQMDLSYVSTDCFHFSQKSNARGANSLWNNLLEPVGNKTPRWTPTWARFLCPSEKYPFLYTTDNGRS